MADNLVDAFREAVRLYPDRPAIVTPEKVWTYREFDRQTDTIAGALRQRIPQPGSRVAIALPNGVDAMLATWGVFKAGLAQVPVDTQWPADQLANALGKLQAAASICGTRSPGPFPIPTWTVDELMSEGLTPPAVQLHAKDIAAIHFTSGSTGEPKGIVLSHGCLLHSARNYQHHLGITAEDRLSWTASFAYGAAGAAYFSALTAGAALLPVRVKDMPLAAWISWLDRERASVIPIASSLFRALANHLPDGPNFPHLRVVKVGGEPVYAGDTELFRRRFHPNCAFINGLGITECGTNVCFFRWDRATPVTTPSVPVGFAADGMELLILNEQGQPQAPGVEGEIAVRGAYLADGYWNAPALTRARFAPLSDDPRPVYRTGDLGRLDKNGRLLHTGSKAFRYKVRGYQVDAVEVESFLRTLPGVENAAVAVRTLGGSDKLVAWLQGPHAFEWSASRIRRERNGILPDYMLPAFVQPVSEFPRQSNGKLDRFALLHLPLSLRTAGGGTEDTLEQQLIRIWEKVLGVSGIGVADNFYDLGGDSLAAVSLFAQIEHRLGIDLPMLHISDCPTVAALAARIRDPQSRADVSASAILLQAGDTNDNFFCLPGGGMDVASLVDLARQLGNRINFYGLQLPGMEGRHAPCATVEAIADALEPEIKRIQTGGAYHLGGVSFGGLVAFELAHRLTRAGKHVATLAMFDVYGPGSLERKRHLSAWKRLRAWWYMQFPIRPRRRPENRAWRIWRIVREQFRRLRSGLWLWTNRDPRALPRELRFDYYARLCNRAARAYVPAPISVPIDLFSAEEQPFADVFQMQPDMGWTPLARAGLHRHVVPGTHATHFRAPYAGTTAQRLAECLDQRIANEARHLADKSRDIWDKLADWWDEQLGPEGNSPSGYLFAAEVTHLLDPKPGQRVLEIACGNGWQARRLAAMGVHVTATDFSARLLERARQHTTRAGLSVEYRPLDVTKQDDWEKLPAAPFDAAVCNMALMDMADISLLFPQLARRLKPGAPFVFSIVNPEGRGLADTTSGKILTGIGLPDQPFRHYYFHRSVAELTSLAQQAGFRIDHTEERTATPEQNLPTAQFLIVRTRAPD